VRKQAKMALCAILACYYLFAILNLPSQFPSPCSLSRNDLFVLMFPIEIIIIHHSHSFVNCCMQTKPQQQLMPVEVRVTKSLKVSNNSGDLETTFDVDGHVETIVGHVSSSSSGTLVKILVILKVTELLSIQAVQCMHVFGRSDCMRISK